jgi:hypothetical protein
MINFRYIAFISYTREDEVWAIWLQNKLEKYKIPDSVRKTDLSLPKRVGLVFKDTTDLTGCRLKKAIKNALYTSKFLIVICSPRAARSSWVCEEVKEFIELGRNEYIIPFVIKGEPNSSDVTTECFPEKIKELTGERELLGVNINDLGRDAAVIKVVATIFGLHFDDLWKRTLRKEQKRRRITIVVLLVIIVLVTGITILIRNTNIELEEQKKELECTNIELEEQKKELEYKNIELEYKNKLITLKNAENSELNKKEKQLKKELTLSEQRIDSLLIQNEKLRNEMKLQAELKKKESIENEYQKEQMKNDLNIVTYGL